MNPIHIRKHIDSETLHLPELREVMGQDVEITIVPRTEHAVEPPTPTVDTPYDALFELAGTLDLDWDAYKETREASRK